MILEGSLLHYGSPRVVVTDDRDLALLLGDQLYALGLSRLAELGDLEAVAELADVISLLSQAQLSEDAALAGRSGTPVRSPSAGVRRPSTRLRKRSRAVATQAPGPHS